MVPREHGAWVMLYAPLLLGLVHGSGGRTFAWLDAVGVALLVTGLFCARVPLGVLMSRRASMHQLARRWAIRYAELVVAGAVLLSRHPHREALAVIASIWAVVLAAYFLFRRIRLHRSVAGEFVAVAGLALTAPLGYFTALGDSWMRAGCLWLLCFLYFGSAVLYVKWRLARHRGTGARREVVVLAAYYVIVAIGVAALLVLNVAPLMTAVAFTPLALRYGLTVITGSKPSLVQIGVSEILLSGLFVGVLLWAL